MACHPAGACTQALGLTTSVHTAGRAYQLTKNDCHLQAGGRSTSITLLCPLRWGRREWGQVSAICGCPLNSLFRQTDTARASALRALCARLLLAGLRNYAHT